MRAERILSSILKFLSKLLIRNNISLSTVTESIKRSLVRAAMNDGASTDSLISLRTGVHRKDVKRIRILKEEGRTENVPIKGLSHILSLWANDNRFRDAKGQPRRLMRKGANGFDDLVRVSKADLSPATVLQELLQQDLVAQDENGEITLLSSTFVGQSGEAALKAFEATVTDHLRVATQNVLSPPGAPRNFDQVVRYSHLSDTSVAKLETEARKEARKYLEHLNTMAHRLQSEDIASGNTSNGRFVSGVFVAPRSDSEIESDARAPKKDKDK